MKNTKAVYTVSDMTYTAMMSVLIAACSWISLPIGPVPFTLQTFAVFCALNLLGGRRGTRAIILYILLGAVGLPVFSGFAGGMGKLLGPTGGYIIGFLFVGLFYGSFEELADRHEILRAVVLAAGLLICYAFGTAWFVFVYNRGGGSMSTMTALGLCVFPFLLPDAFKLAVSIIFCRTLKKHISF